MAKKKSKRPRPGHAAVKRPKRSRSASSWATKQREIDDAFRAGKISAKEHTRRSYFEIEKPYDAKKARKAAGRKKPKRKGKPSSFAPPWAVAGAAAPPRQAPVPRPEKGVRLTHNTTEAGRRLRRIARSAGIKIR